MNIARLHVAAFCFAALNPLAVAAEPVTNYLPDNALGFVVVHNLAQASGKVERVGKLFQAAMPLPAPLAVLKAATGLEEGVNEHGDAALALLPGERNSPNERPLLIIPVTDYPAFASSIAGDVSGDISRVSVAGEEVLVARLGDYAAFMNVEHRLQFEAVVARPAKASVAIKPLSDWMAEMDVAVVLTPSGAAMLTRMARTGPAGRRAAQQDPFAEPELADGFFQVPQMLEMYEEVVRLLDRDLAALALGAVIDENSNLKLGGRAVLSSGDARQSSPSEAVANGAALAGYRNEPYVFAVGGAVPPDVADSASSFIEKFLRAHPESYGFQKLDDDQWEQARESWRLALDKIQSFSMIMLPGGADDPLYSNFYGVIEVEDASAYLKSYAQSVEIWNKLLAGNSTGIEFQYSTTETDVGGKKGLLLTADLSEVANDPAVPTMKPLMEAMLGEDGKMLIYLLAADDKTVYMGIAEEDAVAAGMSSALKHEKGLADSAETKNTLALVDPRADWVAVVSPSGSVSWATRFVNVFLAQFGQAPPAIPAFPPSPPIGLSLAIEDDDIAMELILPVGTLEAAAAYIKTISDAS